MANLRAVIRGEAFDTAFRQFQQTRGSVFVGGLRWNHLPSIAECLVDQVVAADSLPTHFSTFEFNACGSVILFRQTPPSQVDLMAAVEQHRQHFDKVTYALFVLVVIHGPTTGWIAGLAEPESWTPIDEVFLVSSQSTRLSSQPETPVPLPGREDRYSRLAGALDTGEYDRLRRQTVTVVGAGRLGSLTCVELASLGIARLRVADPDRMEPGNLDAMLFHNEEDIGTAKVTSLAEKIVPLRPDMQLSLFDRSIRSHEGSEFLAERADLLITTVDDDLPRLIVAKLCRRLLIPHLDVATSIQRRDGIRTISADIRLIVPGQGCMACVGKPRHLQTLLLELQDSPDCLPRLRRRRWDQQRAGSLISINSIAVGAAMQMWLDMLAGRIRTSFWQRMAWTEQEGLVCHAGPVGAADGCTICS